MRAADKFLRSGGEHFSHVPCLNDSELAIDLLSDIIGTELQGWSALLPNLGIYAGPHRRYPAIIALR